MKTKIYTTVSTIMLFIPWGLLFLRRYDWALQMPMAKILISGCAASDPVCCSAGCKPDHFLLIHGIGTGTADLYSAWLDNTAGYQWFPCDGKYPGIDPADHPGRSGYPVIPSVCGGS